MELFGKIIDSVSKKPVEKAKITLSVKNKEAADELAEELAIRYTNSEGKFEHKEETQYIGETLIYKVEKDGYKPLVGSIEIEGVKVTLERELTGDDIEVRLKLKDQTKNPLENVKIDLAVDGNKVGDGSTDKDGLFKITLGPEYSGKELSYKADLANYETASGKVPLRGSTQYEITMIRPTPIPPPEPVKNKPLPVIPIVGGVLALVLIVAAAYFLMPKPVPVIDEFKAFPKEIIGFSGTSILSWKVSNADNASLNGEKVGLSGNKTIHNITESMTYTLVAQKGNSRVEERLEVLIVKPVIKIIRSGDEADVWKPVPYKPESWGNRVGDPLAQWIWATSEISDPAGGEVQNYTRKFYVNGTPISGKLAITADNGYQAFLNDKEVGMDGLNPANSPWNAPGKRYDSGRSFLYAKTYNITDKLVGQGENTLKVVAVNYAAPGATYNPAGLLYSLNVSWIPAS